MVLVYLYCGGEKREEGGGGGGKLVRECIVVTLRVWKRRVQGAARLIMWEESTPHSCMLISSLCLSHHDAHESSHFPTTAVHNYDRTQLRPYTTTAVHNCVPV